MSVTHDIEIGASSEQSFIVTRDLTIAAFDERLPTVFATPAMIKFMEVMAAQAIQPSLPAGWMSVGVIVNVRHLAATPEGATVRVAARVTAVNDQHITFTVEAYDHIEKIGEGTHVRALVERSRFLRGVERKAPAGPSQGL